MSSKLARVLFLSLLVFVSASKAHDDFGCIDQQNFVGGFCDMFDFDIFVDTLPINSLPIQFILSDAIIQAILDEQTAAENAAMQAKVARLDRIVDGDDYEVGDPDKVEGPLFSFPTPPPVQLIERTNGRFKFILQCAYGCNAGASVWENGSPVNKDSEGYYNFSDGWHDLEVRECFTTEITGLLCFTSHVDLDVDPIAHRRIVFFDSDDPDMVDNPDANGDCQEDEVPVEDNTEKSCVTVDDDGGDLDIAKDNGYVLIGCGEDEIGCFRYFTTNEMIEYSNNVACGIASIAALGAAKTSALIACRTPESGSAAQNAFEHTAWQWRLTNQCGAAFATAAGNAREAYDGNEQLDEAMDQFFNARGRALHAANGGTPVAPTIKADVNANSSKVRSEPKTCP